tara:strand:+ start:1075 stop:1263 length:189 start_codon:yes stop_codon:yes gene_type:complete
MKLGKKVLETIFNDELTIDEIDAIITALHLLSQEDQIRQEAFYSVSYKEVLGKLNDYRKRID